MRVGPHWSDTLLPRVVEDDPEREAPARADAAHAVVDRAAEDAGAARHRPDARREDDELAARARDRVAHGLRAWPVLHEQELAALVVARVAQERGELQREGHLAVDVLVEAVVPARLVVQQERSRLGLPGPRAAGQELVEGRRVALGRAEPLHP